MADLLLAGQKQADMQRLAAFIKRLVATACAGGGAESMGCLALAYRLLRRYPRMLGMLEWEGDAPVGGERGRVLFVELKICDPR